MTNFQAPPGAGRPAAPSGPPPGYRPPPGYGPGGYGPSPGGPPPPYGVPAQRTAVFAGGPVGPPPGGFGAPPPDASAPAPRRRGLVVTATVAVVALIAAGIGAYFWISRSTGGAESPTAAVQLLAADLSAKRYLDAVGRLQPGEADLFRDAGEVVVTELERLQVLRPETDLGALSGQIDVRDLRFSETPRMVRDNVAITELVGGVVTISADPSTIPFTDSFAKLAFPDGPPPAGQPTEIDIAQVVAQQGEPLRVASVEVDGGWYVSLFYTVADYALASENLAWPTTSIAPRGAATPNDALRETVNALLDGNIQRLVELAPPGELSVLHDVGPVLVAQAGAQPIGGQLVELETTQTDVRGDTALAISRVVVQVPDGRRLTVTRTGECIDLQGSDGSAQRLCTQDVLKQADLGVTDPALKRVLPRLVQAMLDIKIVTTEIDGAYYVSPGRTLVGIYADLLGTLQPEDLADLLSSSVR